MATNNAKNNAMVPTNDYVFKRIFGHKGNEKITSDLISSILGREIKDVDLTKNTILEKDLKSDKIGVLDVKAIFPDKTICDIEMQVANHEKMMYRILYYWSKLYSSKITEGEHYEKLHKTICILITDYSVKEMRFIDKYHTKWQIQEEEYSKNLLTDALEIHIISLKRLMYKLKKNQIDKNDKVAMWGKFIKSPKQIKESEMSDMIKAAKKELSKLEQNEHERYLAEQREIYIRDKHDTELYGYNRGIRKGKREGKKEGLFEGERKAKENLVINMYKEKIAILTIAKVTKLSEEEIAKIIEKYKEKIK